MNQAPDTRRYASTHHPSIAAVIAGTYRFPDRPHALQHIQILRDHFVLSRQQSEDAADEGIILWIKGYDITVEEKKEGFTGNYAVIHPVELHGGKITLRAMKLESELKYHPQRRRPKHKHPNWGHPILRSVKKKRIYPTAEAAQAELQLLHEEYSQTTIPLTSKLYTIIYSRQQTPPAQKYVLEIKVAEAGGFYIDAYPNDYKAAPTPVNKKKAESASEEPPQGYFSSMVALRRVKKGGGAKPEAATAGSDTDSGASA